MTALRRLDPARDRAAAADLFARAGDYVELERGPTPVAESVADLFDADPPPGTAPARAVLLGAWTGDRLDGVLEMVFGYPEPLDAYIGLLLLAPEARGAGLGARMLREAEAIARGAGATRLLVAVLDANPQGRAFWAREGFSTVLRFEGRAIGARVHDLARMAKAL